MLVNVLMINLIFRFDSFHDVSPPLEHILAKWLKVVYSNFSTGKYIKQCVQLLSVCVHMAQRASLL